MQRRLFIDGSGTVGGRPLVLESIYFPTLVGAYAKALRGIADVVVALPLTWHAPLRDRLEQEGVDGDVHLVEALEKTEGEIVLDLHRVHHPSVLRKAIKNSESVMPEPAWVISTESDLGRAAATLERHDMYMLARILVIPVARRIAHFLLPTAVSPNAVTFASALFGVAGAAVLLLPGWGWRVAAAIAIHLSITLDFTDGYLARLRGTDSKVGYWFDTVMDEVVKFALFLGLTFLVFQHGPEWGGWMAALVLLLYHVLTCSHWLTQSLDQNDPSKIAPSAAPRWRPGPLGVLQRAYDRLGYLDVHLYLVAVGILFGAEFWLLLLFSFVYSFRFVRMLQVRLASGRLA